MKDESDDSWFTPSVLLLLVVLSLVGSCTSLNSISSSMSRIADQRAGCLCH